MFDIAACTQFWVPSPWARRGWDGSRAGVPADGPETHPPCPGTSPPLVPASGMWLPWQRRPREPRGSGLTRAGAPARLRRPEGPRLPPSLWSCHGQPTASFKNRFQVPLQLRGRNSRLSLLFVGSINSQSFRSLSRNVPRTHTGPMERLRVIWLQQGPAAARCPLARVTSD